MNEREALKLALEALENGTDSLSFLQREKAITVIREALAEQPPQRKPLTDEQWQVIADTLECLITRKQKDAIEAVIGIKE